MDPLLLVPLLLAEAFGLAAIVSRAIEAPVGYEDSKGFHIGEDPEGADNLEF